MAYPRAVILMYHTLRGPGSDPIPPGRQPYRLDPGKFRDHLKFLKNSRRLVAPVRDWVSESAGASGTGVPSGEPWVLITFDDGDETNFTHALPLLEEAGMRATFFVTVGRIGERGFLDWSQLRRMCDAGMEIGSHTVTHRAPLLLSHDELRYEVVESKKRLEDRLGKVIVSLSSPTGFFNPRMSLAAREAGYRALCYGRVSVAGPGSDLFALPRIAVKDRISDSQFARIVEPSRTYLARMRAGQIVRNGLKHLLGHEAYLRVRRSLLRLGLPRGR